MKTWRHYDLVTTKTWKVDRLHKASTLLVIDVKQKKITHIEYNIQVLPPCTFHTNETASGTERELCDTDWKQSWLVQAGLSDSSNCCLQCTSNLSPNFVLCLQTYCHSVDFFHAFPRRVTMTGTFKQKWNDRHVSCIVLHLWKEVEQWVDHADNTTTQHTGCSPKVTAEEICYFVKQ